MINKIMSKPFTTENFLHKANAKFNFKFNYSRLEYKNANTKVTIICPVHGDFETTPWNHIKSAYGCARCGVDAMAEKQKEQTRKKFELFIKETKTNYDYSLTNFEKITDKIIVICPTHGEFSLTVDHHIRGVGCKKCADQSKTGGYTDQWFDYDVSRKETPGMLYVLEMFSPSEKFIKIGITKNSVKKRYAGSKYQYRVIKLVYGSLYQCYQLETRLKHHFKPNIFRNSKNIHVTESFNLACKNDILRALNDCSL